MITVFVSVVTGIVVAAGSRALIIIIIIIIFLLLWNVELLRDDKTYKTRAEKANLLQEILRTPTWA